MIVKVDGYFRSRFLDVDEENHRLMFQVATHRKENPPCRYCQEHFTEIEARMKELGLKDYRLEDRGETQWYNFPLSEGEGDPLTQLSHLIGRGVRISKGDWP